MERREILKIIATAVRASVTLPQSAFARIGEAFNPAYQTIITEGHPTS